MTDVGYVVAGWAITAAVLVGYWASVVVRVRAAQRSERPAAGRRESDGSPTP